MTDINDKDEEIKRLEIKRLKLKVEKKDLEKRVTYLEGKINFHIQNCLLLFVAFIVVAMLWAGRLTYSKEPLYNIEKVEHTQTDNSNGQHKP